MKKLFTLIALFAICLGAKAEKETIAFTDYSTWTEWNMYKMGYVPVIKDGALWSSTEAGTGFLDSDGNPDPEASGWHQYFMMPAFSASIGQTYEVTFKVKGSNEGTVNVQARWSWSEDAINAEIPVTKDWNEVTVYYPEVAGTNIDLIFQSGDYSGEIEWAWIKVEHDKVEGKPVEWIEWLENGDASKDWADPTIAFDDQTANFTICSWSKDSQKSPYPSPIEEVDGDRVFVVHATDCVNPSEDASAWDNQYWIQSPKSWNAGEQIKISFRYKASQTAKTNTQVHKQNPSDYLIWHAIGDITFSTDWQTFSKTVTWEDDMNGGWSIAFNLNAEVKTATDFYFDDLSWATMKLDEGYFVAGDYNDWDLANADEFVYNEDEEYYEVSVGTPEKGASQIKISTKRGDNGAYEANLLKLDRAVTDDAEDWVPFTVGYQKINLPAAGVWHIMLDPSEDIQAIAFEKTADANGVEKPKETCRRIEINAGDKTGEAWDNQFWIVANRVLAGGEATHIKFEYKATDAAKSSTQCHADAGDYLHWAAIGDVNFGEDWKTFEADFTIPAECNAGEDSEDPAPGTPRMKSIAFNLSEYAAANDYMFRNISWTCGDESLINNGDLKTDDASSFIMKVNAGDAAGQLVPAAIVGGGDDYINAITVNTNNQKGFYNLAGQKVNLGYKGIVIKNGKKYIVK